jgi:hypothetical protein
MDVRYRFVTADIDGRFELRGIAPGAYHVFAWPDIEAGAYRNADFMKQYEDRGQALRINRDDERHSIALTSF